MIDIQTADQHFKEFLLNLKEDDLFHLSLHHFFDEYLVSIMIASSDDYDNYRKYISIKSNVETTSIDNQMVESYISKLSELEVQLMFYTIFSKDRIIEHFINSTNEDSMMDILESHHPHS